MKKVFLGGYINTINAQNINCKALATFLDKEQFQVYAMQLASNDEIELPHVKSFICRKPYALFKSLAYLWGVWKCDILYLPKYAVDAPRWLPSVAKLLGKKMISTLEIPMYETEHYQRYVSCFNNEAHFIQQFQSLDAFYAITAHLKKTGESKPIGMAEKVLYLGVDFQFFHTIHRVKESIRNIVFVGILSERKNAADLLYLSGKFPAIHFHLVGSGPELNTLKATAGSNVTFYGKLGHSDMLEVLQKADLHFLPSRSEGFPKVILETAAAGIPSMVYPDYGAAEWIQHNENGFIVNNREEAATLLTEWQNRSLVVVSDNSVKMAAAFDWKVVVKNWEIEFAK